MFLFDKNSNKLRNKDSLYTELKKRNIIKKMRDGNESEE